MMETYDFYTNCRIWVPWFDSLALEVKNCFSFPYTAVLHINCCLPDSGYVHGDHTRGTPHYTTGSIFHGLLEVLVRLCGGFQ